MEYDIIMFIGVQLEFWEWFTLTLIEDGRDTTLTTQINQVTHQAISIWEIGKALALFVNFIGHFSANIDSKHML
jgi:hypothetical protein